MNWFAGLLVAASSLATFGLTWNYQANKYQNQIADILLDQAATSAKEADKALAYERQLHEALQSALLRNRDLALIASRTDAESRSLRQQLASANRRIETASIEAVREYAIAAGAVFGECAQALGDLAQKADGHASDVLTFRDAWPVTPDLE